MMMRKLIGLFVAIAFIAGSTTVHAIKLVGAANVDPETAGTRSATYAKETLLKGDANTTEASDPDDDTTYYNIVRDHVVSGPADITATATQNESDVYIVSYSLSGMIFSEDVTAGDDISVQRRTVAQDGAVSLADAPAEASLQRIVAGGKAGDNELVLRFGGTASLDGRSDVIALTANFAISEGGSGSITRTVLNRTLEDSNVKASMTHSLSGAIRTAAALKQTIKPNETNHPGNRQGPTASVEFDFNVFYPSTSATKELDEWMGYVQLSVVGMSVPAADGNDATEEGRRRNAQHDPDIQSSPPADVTMLVQIAGPDQTTLASGTVRRNNSVTFGGDLSFVKKFALSDDNDCSTTYADMRVPSTDDPDVLTDEVSAQKAIEILGSTKFLCIEVDGETSIPMTEPYTVTTSYKGLTDAAFPPGGGTYELAGISRDGTTFAIPYLTTFSEYNQRISIVNHGSKAVMYTFGDLLAEEGVTVTAGAAASGELPPMGQTVLRTTDIVEITGGDRASAVLRIVAPPDHISAAIQQINKMDRGVDTVYLR